VADASRTRRRIWWLVAGLILAALIVYLAIPKPVPVRGAAVRSGVLSLFLSATGVVEGRIADVTSRLTARLTALTAEEGDAVAAGQVLAQQDTSDLQAEIARQRAAVSAAQQQAAAARQTARAAAEQQRGTETRAEAAVDTARANLRLVQAGARTEELAVQRAAVAQAQAQVTQARQAYLRAQRLHAEGAIATQRLEEAAAAYETARAQLTAQEQQLLRLQSGARTEEIEAARAQVQAAEAALREARAGRGGVAAREREADAAAAQVAQAQAALRAAQAQLSYATVRSPFAGVVVEKHKEVGEMASPYEPIYSVANLQQIWVTAEIDEEDVAAVAVGQRVTVTLDAFPGRAATGVVARVGQVAQSREVGRVRAKVVPARITLVRSTLPLRPGMEVNVTGSLPTGRTTLLVPNDAIFRSGDQDRVYVIADQRAHVRTVTIGQSNFEQTQILSGLRAGEVVAVSNLDRLADGARVRRVE